MVLEFSIYCQCINQPLVLLRNQQERITMQYSSIFCGLCDESDSVSLIASGQLPTIRSMLGKTHLTVPAGAHARGHAAGFRSKAEAASVSSRRTEGALARRPGAGSGEPAQPTPADPPLLAPDSSKQKSRRNDIVVLRKDHVQMIQAYFGAIHLPTDAPAFPIQNRCLHACRLHGPDRGA